MHIVFNGRHEPFAQRFRDEPQGKRRCLHHVQHVREFEFHCLCVQNTVHAFSFNSSYIVKAPPSSNALSLK